MIFEKSCGAVILNVADKKGKFLIEKMKKGHISMCKGHVEKGENEHMTAVREIKEETGIEVEFIDGFRETIEYMPYSGCTKQVVFFAATAKDSKTIPQEIEVSEIYWLDEKEALEKLTHKSDREILNKAVSFFKEKGYYID